MHVPLRIAIPSVIGLSVGMAVLTSGQADHAPARVTTDTAEYCNQLAGQVAPLITTPQTGVMQQASALSDEGQHMCEQGQIRAGIARLRRALLLLKVQPGSTP